MALFRTNARGITLWHAELGRQRGYARYEDAVLYDQGWGDGAGLAAPPPYRSAYLDGLGDRNEDSRIEAQAAALDRAIGGEGHLEVDR